MALTDLFRRKSPLEKATKDLLEPYAQPDVRRAAMATLLDLGTPEAYVALLKRFNYNANGHIADEAEKRDMVTEIVQVGEKALEPIKAFIRTEKALVFPIRALSQLVTKEELLAFLVETLKSKDPLDHRSTESKRMLIVSIGDYGSAENAMALTPYLDDHHDDVQMQAIEALERLASEDTIEPIVKVLSGDMHANRVQQRAAQALVHLAWPMKKYYPEFADSVKREFLVTKNGTLVQKASAQASE